jgi:hypothetical protein
MACKDTDVEPAVIETSLDLNQGVPQVIMDLISSGRSFLGVDPAWHIYVKMNDTPAGSDENAASTIANDVYYIAHLEFASCAVSEAENIRVQYVLHELLHVSLAELDAVIDEMMALLPKKIKKVLQRKYHDEVERFIQKTVRGITDNPGILQDYAATFQEKSDANS